MTKHAKLAMPALLTQLKILEKLHDDYYSKGLTVQVSDVNADIAYIKSLINADK